MTTPRTIRIFASSPADLSTERKALASAVQELNTTIHALLPEKRIALELVAWETHTHPDVGADPQAVIDAQLGSRCDVFVGMIWKRFGTPTPKWGSGTEQEFRSAYAGWKTHRRPAHVLFYFSEAPVSPTLTHADLEQLGLIGAFRAELETLGLVGNYPAPEAFGDLVRRHLVLVLSKLLHADASPDAFAETVERASAGDLASVEASVAAAADEYERIRGSMPSSNARTRQLEVVATQMRTLAQASFALVPDLVNSESPGRRLAAITALQAIPHRDYLDWLATRVAVEPAFAGYHASVALMAAARELPDVDFPLIDRALDHAEADALDHGVQPDADRVRSLRNARAELARRRERAGVDG